MKTQIEHVISLLQHLIQQYADFERLWREAIDERDEAKRRFAEADAARRHAQAVSTQLVEGKRALLARIQPKEIGRCPTCQHDQWSRCQEGDHGSIPLTASNGVTRWRCTYCKTYAALEAAEGKLDIILRATRGEPDDELAVDYGGTGWENDPAVKAVYERLNPVWQSTLPTANGYYMVQLPNEAKVDIVHVDTDPNWRTASYCGNAVMSSLDKDFGGARWRGPLMEETEDLK